MHILRTSQVRLRCSFFDRDGAKGAFLGCGADCSSTVQFPTRIPNIHFSKCFEEGVWDRDVTGFNSPSVAR